MGAAGITVLGGWPVSGLARQAAAELEATKTALTAKDSAPSIAEDHSGNHAAGDVGRRPVDDPLPDTPRVGYDGLL
jgi:hypothetical protein